MVSNNSGFFSSKFEIPFLVLKFTCQVLSEFCYVHCELFIALTIFINWLCNSFLHIKCNGNGRSMFTLKINSCFLFLMDLVFSNRNLLRYVDGLAWQLVWSVSYSSKIYFSLTVFAYITKLCPSAYCGKYLADFAVLLHFWCVTSVSSTITLLAN